MKHVAGLFVFAALSLSACADRVESNSALDLSTVTPSDGDDDGAIGCVFSCTPHGVSYDCSATCAPSASVSQESPTLSSSTGVSSPDSSGSSTTPPKSHGGAGTDSPSIGGGVPCGTPH